MREEINAIFNENLFSLNNEEPSYEARKKYFEKKKDKELDAVDSFEKTKKAKKRKIQDVEDKISHYLNPGKTKMIIDFKDRDSASIKSFAVKKKNEIKVTTRFMSGKLLMFAKLSLKSFIYTLAETLYSPNSTVKEIYRKYQIERILCYHVLTDTDSI